MKQEKVATLDYYVIKALDFLEKRGHDTLFPEDPEKAGQHTLVVGSQSGWLAGRIVYRFARACFSHTPEVLAQYEIDTKRKWLHEVTIVSATGSRNVIPVARYAMKKELKVNAIVCQQNSELERAFGKRIHFMFVEAIPEPPTINTATYGGMIQGVTHEDIARIRKAVDSLGEPPGGYKASHVFTVILSNDMTEVAGMVDWKLRGEKIGRCIGSMAATLTNFMHGAGVTDAVKEHEVYIALGLNEDERNVFAQVFENVEEERKYYINLPSDFGPLGYMMVGYALVGRIQRAYPAFQERIWKYTERARGWHWIDPIHGDC